MKLREILDAIRKLNVLVVGDICLDRWCTYAPETSEPSRETGIPRIGVVATEVTPGAGGTVANNLLALGVSRVSLLGIVGDDGFGFELLRQLNARGASTDLMVQSPSVNTFTYTKLINRVTGTEDLPRVDYIRIEPFPAEVEARIASTLQQFGEMFDLVIVADQAETGAGGVVNSDVRELLSEIQKPVWVDSRVRSELFRNVMVKTNREEAEAALMRAAGRLDYAYLVERCGCPLHVITTGPDGALLIDKAGQTTVPGIPVTHPVDICGAGDSFTAGAATAIAVGASPTEAAQLGNLVSSITIMKKGTGTASPVEVLAAGARWMA